MRPSDQQITWPTTFCLFYCDIKSSLTEIKCKKYLNLCLSINVFYWICLINYIFIYCTCTVSICYISFYFIFKCIQTGVTPTIFYLHPLPLKRGHCHSRPTCREQYPKSILVCFPKALANRWFLKSPGFLRDGTCVRKNTQISSAGGIDVFTPKLPRGNLYCSFRA